MNLSKLGLVLVITCGLIGGIEQFCEWMPISKARSAPIVTGQVLSRTPCKVQGVPSVDFEIHVEGVMSAVHARTGRYLMNKVPETVRFHYSGDPSAEVFLFEYERNPLWISLFCLGTALLFSIIFVCKLKSRAACRR